MQNCSEGVADLESKLFLPSSPCPAQPLGLPCLHLSKIRLWTLLGMVRGGLCSKGTIPSLPLGMALTRQCRARGWGSGTVWGCRNARDGADRAPQPHSLGQDGDQLSGAGLRQTLSGVTEWLYYCKGFICKTGNIFSSYPFFRLDAAALQRQDVRSSQLSSNLAPHPAMEGTRPRRAVSKQIVSSAPGKPIPLSPGSHHEGGRESPTPLSWEGCCPLQ